MAKNLSSRAVKKSLPRNIYGDEIGAYIEECRQFVASSRRQEVIVESTEVIQRFRGKNKSRSRNNNQELTTRETSLRKLESELNKREVELIEREIKFYGQQQELEQLRPLLGLNRVIQAMAGQHTLESLLEVIALETRNMLKCERCSVFVVDPKNNQLWSRVALGVDENVIQVPLSGTSIVSVTARSGQTINIPDAYNDSRFDPSIDETTGYRTHSILCVPMNNRSGEVIGVFEALNKIGRAFTEADKQWLQGLAAVAAGLIEQAQSYSEIEIFVDKTLETLAQTIDKRDPLTAGHSMRVTRYSLLMGEALGLSQGDIDILRYSAMMHDYGKIGVPEAVLWKNGRLTPQEYKLVQTHARITYELLSNLPFTSRLASVPFVASCHHEKLDGSGYYRGLKGAEIPYLTRIITVADVFDALTSVRHYRNRMAITKVTEIMDSGRENHFEAEIIDAFYNLPADLVLKVMESERGQTIPAELDLFHKINLKRLVDLCNGAKPKGKEAVLAELFDRIYNSGLPSDYQALD